MAFSTVRGRPRKPAQTHDLGTPELRLKHALRVTAEPIDLCLEKQMITPQQHWCGLHLRWLYTLRYGAPSLTTHYTDRDHPASTPMAEDPGWRSMREREYHEAAVMLRARNRYECVMRLCVFNERPAFLSSALREKAFHQPHLAERMSHAQAQLREGLDLLVLHWRRHPETPGTNLQQ